MTSEMRTYLQYVAAAFVAFLTGALTYVVPLLIDPSEPPISWRVLVGTVLSAVVAAGFSTRIIRPGGEAIAAQTRVLHERGVSKADMIVVPSASSTLSRSDAVDANPRIAELAPVLDDATKKSTGGPPASETVPPGWSGTSS